VGALQLVQVPSASEHSTLPKKKKVCPYEIYRVQELVPRGAFCQYLAEDPTFIRKALFTHESCFAGTEINIRKNHAFK
jgi:hypothetical protein